MSTFNAAISENASLIASAEETSHRTISTFRPIFIIADLVASSESFVRPTKTMSAPACANA